MKMASRLTDLITEKSKLHVQHAFLSFPCRRFARLQRCFVRLRAYLHEGGGPQVGGVTCVKLPHLTCKRDHIKMRDCLAGGLPHLSGLPHLPGVSHLHVNRP